MQTTMYKIDTQIYIIDIIKMQIEEHIYAYKI